MPRDAIVLSDLKAPDLHFVCKSYGRRGRYAVARLMAEHGDAKLTDLLPAILNCPWTAHSTNIYDRCKAVYKSLAIA